MDFVINKMKDADWDEVAAISLKKCLFGDNEFPVETAVGEISAVFLVTGLFYYLNWYAPICIVRYMPTTAEASGFMVLNFVPRALFRLIRFRGRSR